MSAEENKALVRRVLEEAFNKGNLEIVDELVDVTCDYQASASTAANPGGPERLKQIIMIFRTAFPDLHITIEDQIVKGNKVVTRWRAHGTHLGELLGVPSTGRGVTITGIAIGRIAARKLVEYWGNFDALGLIQQLGAIPGAGGMVPAATRGQHADSIC